MRYVACNMLHMDSYVEILLHGMLNSLLLFNKSYTRLDTVYNCEHINFVQ